MKKSVYTFIALAMATGLFAQNKEYVLNGSVVDTNYNGSIIYLHAIDDSFRNLITLDSTIVNDGNFSFKKNVSDSPSFQIISIGRIEAKGLSTKFVAEPGIISIVLDSVSETKGTENNDIHNIFANKKESLYSKMRDLQASAEELYNAGKLSEEDASVMKAEFENYGKQYTDLNYSYIKDNIANKLGEYYYITSSRGLTLKQLDEIYKLSSEDFRQTEAMKQMQSMIEAQKPKPYDGGRFKDVELSTPDGKKSSISNYVGKGKIVLIDFWASWCGPCRNDMPRLVALYDKYKDKGFEILGISLDDNLGSWTKAMESMNMTWPNISDLRGWTSKAARIYNVNRIPQSFLIDKDGNIVGADLKQDALIYKIEELLDKNL